MKRLIVFVLALACLLCLVGCNKSPEYITDEKGKQYLILPVSKEQVKVRDEQKAYLSDIDYDILKEAEEKLTAQVSQYKTSSKFYLQIDNEYLCLYKEVIISIDLPEDSSSEDGKYTLEGCGIDHKHLFFCERITK